MFTTLCTARFGWGMVVVGWGWRTGREVYGNFYSVTRANIYILSLLLFYGSPLRGWNREIYGEQYRDETKLPQFSNW